MKTVLLIPGFKEDFRTRDYTAVISAIEAKGYKVKFVDINWKRTTIENWVDQLNFVYTSHKPEDTVLAGFSYGAMTAFVAATQRNPLELWLFSLSSYFTEDIKSVHMKKSWLRNIGHRRVSAFDALNFTELAKEIDCKTLLFIGQKELDMWPDMRTRFLAAGKLLKDSTLVTVGDVGHDVADPRYIRSILEAI